MALRKLLISLLRSLQWRLVFIFIAMTISLIMPIGIMLKVQVEKSVYNQFRADIEKGMESLEGKPYKSTDGLWNILRKNGENYSTLYFNMASEHKTFSLLNGKSLNKVWSNDPLLNRNENKAISEIMESENFISALGNKDGSARKLRHLNGKVFFDCAYKKGDIITYFRYYSEGWEEMTKDFNKIILTSLMFSIIISLILGYILSKTITVPVVNLMHKAQEVAKGNFDKLLDVKSEDEIGKLTKTFNYMASELKNTLTEISSEKSKIETILEYMTDGIIAYNIKGDVVHANPAAKKLLGVNSIEIPFNEFSKKHELGLSLEEIEYLNFSGNKEVSITTEDKYIKAYFAVFTDEEEKPEGIIIVLQDVTEQQKIENMRKEFVANVSHELRTPLTSIKSYTETLLDGAMEDRETTERFLGVVNSEADRMTRLVKDLLQLTRLDNQQMQWKLQSVSPVGLVKKSIEKLELEARNKDQQLKSYIIGDIPDIKADADRIEQVILNIISNSIKYTPAGGKITVYTSKLYDDVCFKVIDTGIGIPEKDIPRIFERFYRVDKARSREMGGTGLGLAIAREIVEAHNGAISISSEWGKGTEVVIKLPCEKEEEIDLLMEPADDIQG
jgi:two-component system, OmpR family, sensor histidine kinase VicK